MPGKICLILMHDDGRSQRWRIGPNLRRILVALLVLVPFVAVGSLYINWRLYHAQFKLRTEVISLRSQLEAQSQLNARLTNLERYLEQYDPGALRTLVSGRTDVSPELAWAYALAEFQPAKNSRDLSGTAISDVQSPHFTNSNEPQQTVSSVATADFPATQPTSSQSISPLPPASTTAEALSAQNTSKADILRDAPIDKGLARLENIVARRVGARILRISFDLYNAAVREQLAGRAGFELILADGSLYPLESRGDTHYRINRLKRIVGNPTMPSDVTETDGAYIRITVYENDDIINRLLVPLQN